MGDSDESLAEAEIKNSHSSSCVIVESCHPL